MARSRAVPALAGIDGLRLRCTSFACTAAVGLGVLCSALFAHCPRRCAVLGHLFLFVLCSLPPSLCGLGTFSSLPHVAVRFGDTSCLLATPERERRGHGPGGQRGGWPEAAPFPP